jgi:hypothetical protein
MKSKISLSALVLVLPGFAANAQDSKVVAIQPAANLISEQGVFAYADFYQYDGFGAPGNLGKTETDAHLMIFDLLFRMIGATPSDYSTGKVKDVYMEGETVGYQFATANKDQFCVQFSARSGRADSTIFSGDADYFGMGRIILTDTFKEKIDEYHFRASWTPHQLNFLTFGVEYAYSKYNNAFVSFISMNSADGSETYENAELWNDQFTMKASDFLVHTTVKAPVHTLLATSCGTLSVAPMLDIGVGYSSRSGSVSQGGENDFMTYDPASYLNKNAWIIEGTAAFDLSYQMKSGDVLFAMGYRYKTDLGDEHNNTNQNGVFARLGYAYSW